MATLKLENIFKNFGETEVLKDINLNIDDKEFVVFVGPSGCGKTTLLRIICGLEEATSGKVFIDEEDVSNAQPVDRGISMVFQSYALYPHLSVFENIAFPLRVAKINEAELKERVDRAAEILQLTDRLEFKPGQLSGGQRQRVAIGRSIVRNPRVFLFDEPLSNLDAALRGDMRVELAKLHQNLKTTMIYVTHDQIEAMTMADKIVVLNDGVVQQFGAPMELYHHPTTKFVAGFIGHPKMNFLKTTNTVVDGNELKVNLGAENISLPVEIGQTKSGDMVELGVRPEDLMFSSDNQGLSMNVEVVEHIGATAIIYGSAAGNDDFCAVMPGDTLIHPGQTINLLIDSSKCHAFNSQGIALHRKQAAEVS